MYVVRRNRIDAYLNPSQALLYTEVTARKQGQATRLTILVTSIQNQTPLKEGIAVPTVPKDLFLDPERTNYHFYLYVLW